jgi:hypothetical protein
MCAHLVRPVEEAEADYLSAVTAATNKYRAAVRTAKETCDRIKYLVTQQLDDDERVARRERDMTEFKLQTGGVATDSAAYKEGKAQAVATCKKVIGEARTKADEEVRRAEAACREKCDKASDELDAAVRAALMDKIVRLHKIVGIPVAPPL